jgi:hypothetical protein
MMMSGAYPPQDARERVMARRHGSWLAALVLATGLLLPAGLKAGPMLQALLDCDPDCPPGYYQRLHYWIPLYYQLRHYCHPVNLNQYPPGPCPAVAPSYQMQRFPCPYQHLSPTAPYSDPAGYFGRSSPTAEQQESR